VSNLQGSRNGIIFIHKLSPGSLGLTGDVMPDWRMMVGRCS